jgi:hypothetical protein
MSVVRLSGMVHTDTTVRGVNPQATLTIGLNPKARPDGRADYLVMPVPFVQSRGRLLAGCHASSPYNRPTHRAAGI